MTQTPSAGWSNSYRATKREPLSWKRVCRPGATLTARDVLDHLAPKVAKWWLPDDVQFVEAIPHTATGKILKTRLREDFKAYKLPTA